MSKSQEGRLPPPGLARTCNGGCGGSRRGYSRACHDNYPCPCAKGSRLGRIRRTRLRRRPPVSARPAVRPAAGRRPRRAAAGKNFPANARNQRLRCASFPPRPSRRLARLATASGCIEPLVLATGCEHPYNTIGLTRAAYPWIAMLDPPIGINCPTFDVVLLPVFVPPLLFIPTLNAPALIPVFCFIGYSP